MKLRYIFFLLCMLPLLAVPVSAHPGKTDSSGGHTNRSTGEYHYHHGYPAHQHYDQNGDGKPDCPYEFDDKTDHSSANSSKNGYSAPATTTQKKSNDRDFFDIVGDVLGFAFLGFFVFVIFLYRKK